MIEIDFNQKLGLRNINGLVRKAEYAMGYTIDSTARDVIKFNTHFLLGRSFEWENDKFKRWVGSTMWQYPRGAKGIRASDLRTMLYYSEAKTDDYFSLHEEGGQKSGKRVIPFGATKRARSAKKRLYRKLTKQSGKGRLKFDSATLSRNSKIKKTRTGIFHQKKNQTDPLFTFHEKARFDKTYKFEINAKIHAAKQIDKHWKKYIGLVSRG